VRRSVKEQTAYLSYLLRLWRAGEGSELSVDDQACAGSWRASLENAQTGERVGFGGVEELCRFLKRQIDIVQEGRDEM
jgi:hypothetical protein